MSVKRNLAQAFDDVDSDSGAPAPKRHRSDRSFSASYVPPPVTQPDLVAHKENSQNLPSIFTPTVAIQTYSAVDDTCSVRTVTARQIATFAQSPVTVVQNTQKQEMDAEVENEAKPSTNISICSRKRSRVHYDAESASYETINVCFYSSAHCN